MPDTVTIAPAQLASVTERFDANRVVTPADAEKIVSLGSAVLVPVFQSIVNGLRHRRPQTQAVHLCYLVLRYVLVPRCREGPSRLLRLLFRQDLEGITAS